MFAKKSASHGDSEPCIIFKNNMFQLLKPINYKLISSGFFVFYLFMSGVCCVGCFFARAFLGCLPAKLCTSHKSVAYLLVFQREYLFTRSWPVSLRLFAYWIPIHECALIILNIATFIVCPSIWSFKEVVVTAMRAYLWCALVILFFQFSET